MATATIPPIFDELVMHLAQETTPQLILDFKPSGSAQARAEYLLDRNSSGALTPQEEQELLQMQHFDRLVSTLKAQALEKLAQQ